MDAGRGGARPVLLPHCVLLCVLCVMAMVGAVVPVRAPVAAGRAPRAVRAARSRAGVHSRRAGGFVVVRAAASGEGACPQGGGEE